jgi:hypothetical protein
MFIVHGVGSMIVPTSFVIMHVLDSPRDILPLQSGDRLDTISGPVGKIGLLTVTEYSPSPKITVVPAAEPWNELGDGLFPSMWIE